MNEYERSDYPDKEIDVSNNNEGLTVKEAGGRGGQSTRNKYGPDHFKKIGAIGGLKTLELMGQEHYSQMGKRGGAILRDKLAQMETERDEARAVAKQLLEEVETSHAYWTEPHPWLLEAG